MKSAASVTAFKADNEDDEASVKSAAHSVKSSHESVMGVAADEKSVKSAASSHHSSVNHCIVKADDEGSVKSVPGSVKASREAAVIEDKLV